MTDITTIDSLILLTVFGKENYSSENKFDTDKLNFQESDQPRSDTASVSPQFTVEGRHRECPISAVQHIVQCITAQNCCTVYL